MFLLQRFVNGAIELDQRRELAPARSQRRFRVAGRSRRQPGDDRRKAVLARDVGEELFAPSKHHPFYFGSIRIRSDQNLFSFEARERGGGTLALQKKRHGEGDCSSSNVVRTMLT